MQFRKGNGKDYHGQDVHLTELIGDDGILEGFRFTDCQIIGPAVLIVQGKFDLVDNIIEGDPDAFLWEISPDRERVLGAILVKNNAFEGCTFVNIGLAGRADFIERVREGVEIPAVS